MSGIPTQANPDRPKRKRGKAPRAGGARARQMLEIAQRRAKAFELKTNGVPDAQICKMLGYCHNKELWRDTIGYLRSLAQPGVDEYRRLEAEKLAKMEAKFLPQLLAPPTTNKKTGKLAYVDPDLQIKRANVVRGLIADRRALLGLDRPVAQKVELSGSIDLEMKLVRELTPEERAQFIASGELPARMMPLLGDGTPQDDEDEIVLIPEAPRAQE